MRGVSSRAVGSRLTLRDRLSTRHIAESRIAIKKNATGSRLSGPIKNSAPHSGAIDYRKSGNLRKKPVVVPLRSKDGHFRKPSIKSSARGNGYQGSSRPHKYELGTKSFPNKSLGPHKPSGFRKPVNVHKKYDYKRQDNPHIPARMSESSGRHSTKDRLFKGPEKTWNYHNEDLKKLKIDIRPSHSEVSPSERKKSHLYDRSELKKFKIDIKGENYEDPRSYGTNRSRKQNYSQSVPFSKQELERVKIRLDLDKFDLQDEDHINRKLDVDKFAVPRNHDVKLFNNRDTFSSSRHQEKKDLSGLKVNIVRQLSNPKNEPVRRDFDEDSFQMYRRPDEGVKPIFSNKNVIPNKVRLADIFPSESKRQNKPHTHLPSSHPHQQGHPQKYSDSSRPPRSRSFEKDREYFEERRHPSSDDFHIPSKKEAFAASSKRFPSPNCEPKYRHRPSSPAQDGKHSSLERQRDYGRVDKPLYEAVRRGSPVDKPRDRYDTERRDRGRSPVPSHRPYDTHKSNDRYDHRSRSRSPLKRSPNKSLREFPRPPSPKRRAPSPPTRQPPSIDNKYRPSTSSYDKPSPFEDKYRSSFNKPPALEDKYRSTFNKPPVFEDKYRSTFNKPPEDKFRSTAIGHDKPSGYDGYRSGHERPDDKYRSDRTGSFSDDKYRSRDKPPEDRYRDKPRVPEDKYRSGYEKPVEDRYRSSHDKSVDNRYRSTHDKPASEDRYSSDQKRSGSSYTASERYETRRDTERYPRGYSPDTGRGDKRRDTHEGRRDDHKDRSSPRPPPFSSDPKKNRDYYQNKHSGGGEGDGRGAPIMPMIPVIPHPGVFAPFMRPMHPMGGPPPRLPPNHMFRPRFLPLPIFIPMPRPRFTKRTGK
ncbi:serine/arginine repetitive matrix protein 1-like isoform X3 [Diaphorina citri]|uniref:Serine/arginine repetitive matrix protein 1-like isoform X1 n=1 Tax=Diaphorina citri TaxID=121845 RepID=A0A1S3D2Z1_DIACI|nr:serine/arginine repetitive matrix protein 1-like isoform X2 [Diaphorina citri]XP_017299694.1 serine/arginine repetitive matrix protein 1-like isoform X1 [Diaphorina citri]XP_026679610.1 serine/arginine repetitive matrix protein 1-like isoform X3 [Diaphorina citri]